jgi:hypothetical protein
MTLIGTPNKRRGDNIFNTDIPNWIAILASRCEGMRARDHRAREVPHIQSSKEIGPRFRRPCPSHYALCKAGAKVPVTAIRDIPGRPFVMLCPPANQREALLRVGASAFPGSRRPPSRPCQRLVMSETAEDCFGSKWAKTDCLLCSTAGPLAAPAYELSVGSFEKCGERGQPHPRVRTQ